MPGLGDKTQHTLDELVQNSGQSGSQQAQCSELEFLRRQTIALQEASAAAKETAEHTKRNATYMLIPLRSSSPARLDCPATAAAAWRTSPAATTNTPIFIASP